MVMYLFSLPGYNLPAWLRQFALTISLVIAWSLEEKFIPDPAMDEAMDMAQTLDDEADIFENMEDDDDDDD